MERCLLVGKGQKEPPPPPFAKLRRSRVFSPHVHAVCEQTWSRDSAGKSGEKLREPVEPVKCCWFKTGSASFAELPSDWLLEAVRPFTCSLCRIVRHVQEEKRARGWTHLCADDLGSTMAKNQPAVITP